MRQFSEPLLQRLRSDLSPLRDTWGEAKNESVHPQAAVLVGLTDEPEPRVLLGRRAMHLPLHPGEIAFAGGKREEEDVSPWATATREALEEVGLTADLLQPFGELPPMLTRTGFEVHPCIAGIPEKAELTVDPSEFDSTFYVPLSVFADVDLFRLEVMWDGTRERKVPHYQVGDDSIWGVTAAVLVMLVNVAYDAGFNLERDWKRAP